MRKKLVSEGQSLVEVIVAIGAMSLLLVALLSLVSVSIRNSRLAQNRAQAVALAQEGLELMRAYRDYSWTELIGSSRVDSYNLPYGWTVETGLSQDCPVSYEIHDIYNRCVLVSSLGSTEVELISTVGWKEGNKLQSTSQSTRLAVWER